MNKEFIKSPLNYIGGKYKILNQLIDIFPKDINCFIDLFAGGCNVGINVKANMIIMNDNLTYLIDLYKIMQELKEVDILNHIYHRINEFDLSLTNDIGYKNLRFLYNLYKNPLDLFVLIAFSFNHQIRFNNKHDFNNPFGKERSYYNKTIESNLKQFIKKIQNSNIIFTSTNFQDFDILKYSNNDFFYCDPPYLITRGTYNDGKRGFSGWGIQEEIDLLDKLDRLSKNNIKFALSNVIEHKGKINFILEDWLSKNKNYIINNIDINYSNSNYQTKNRNQNGSKEVLITNYVPAKKM